MADTPNLDLLVCDAMGAHVHLWGTVTRIDDETPVGHPLAPACRVCAGSTVRMRQALTRPFGGRRITLAWVCEGCDASDSGLRLPRGWTL